MSNLQAPHNFPSDGSANPAQTAGTNSHVEYPFAELHARDNATSSGGAEGSATYNPAQQ